MAAEIESERVTERVLRGPGHEQSDLSVLEDSGNLTYVEDVSAGAS
jgi:hypothetical protein